MPIITEYQINPPGSRLLPSATRYASHINLHRLHNDSFGNLRPVLIEKWNHFDDMLSPVPKQHHSSRKSSYSTISPPSIPGAYMNDGSSPIRKNIKTPPNIRYVGYNHNKGIATDIPTNKMPNHTERALRKMGSKIDSYLNNSLTSPTNYDSNNVHGSITNDLDHKKRWTMESNILPTNSTPNSSLCDSASPGLSSYHPKRSIFKSQWNLPTTANTETETQLTNETSSTYPRSYHFYPSKNLKVYEEGNSRGLPQQQITTPRVRNSIVRAVNNIDDIGSGKTTVPILVDASTSNTRRNPRSSRDYLQIHSRTSPPTTSIAATNNINNTLSSRLAVLEPLNQSRISSYDVVGNEPRHRRRFHIIEDTPTENNNNNSSTCRRSSITMAQDDSKSTDDIKNLSNRELIQSIRKLYPKGSFSLELGSQEEPASSCNNSKTRNNNQRDREKTYSTNQNEYSSPPFPTRSIKNHRQAAVEVVKDDNFTSPRKNFSSMTHINNDCRAQSLQPAAASVSFELKEGTSTTEPGGGIQDARHKNLDESLLPSSDDPELKELFDRINELKKLRIVNDDRVNDRRAAANNSNGISSHQRLPDPDISKKDIIDEHVPSTDSRISNSLETSRKSRGAAIKWAGEDNNTENEVNHLHKHKPVVAIRVNTPDTSKTSLESKYRYRTRNNNNNNNLKSEIDKNDHSLSVLPPKVSNDSTDSTDTATTSKYSSAAHSKTIDEPSRDLKSSTFVSSTKSLTDDSKNTSPSIKEKYIIGDDSKSKTAENYEKNGLKSSRIIRRSYSPLLNNNVSDKTNDTSYTTCKYKAKDDDGTATNFKHTNGYLSEDKVYNTLPLKSRVRSSTVLESGNLSQDAVPTKVLSSTYADNTDSSSTTTKYIPWREKLKAEKLLGTTPDRKPSSSKFSGKSGLRGLANLGNTCFLNSILQVLSNTKPLLDYIRNGDYLKDVNERSPHKGEIVKEYAQVLEEMWGAESISNRLSIRPVNLKRKVELYAPSFSGFNQQDAQEFLVYLLSGFHDDLNQAVNKTPNSSKRMSIESNTELSADVSWKKYQETNKSKIVDIFGGQLKSILISDVCNHRSLAYDPFWNLSLPISSETHCPNLYDCLNNFVSEEKLQGDDAPFCSRCKSRQNATKSFRIQRYPSILIIHLKRFAAQCTNGIERFIKIRTPVEFPFKGLDLSKYSSKLGPDSSPSPVNRKGVGKDLSSQDPLYDLYAITCHTGSISSGHYFSYCQNPINKRWYLFEDSKVQEVSQSEIDTNNAYLLFYQNVD